MDCGAFVRIETKSRVSPVKNATVATYHLTKKFCTKESAGQVNSVEERRAAGSDSRNRHQQDLYRATGWVGFFLMQLATLGVA
jgi:hypothetical protein